MSDAISSGDGPGGESGDSGPTAMCDAIGGGDGGDESGHCEPTAVCDGIDGNGSGGYTLNGRGGGEPTRGNEDNGGCAGLVTMLGADAGLDLVGTVRKPGAGGMKGGGL